VLTIQEVTSETDAKKYYAVADYYSQGQETVGNWGGKLATDVLGLTGKVTKDAFDRMVDNRHPVEDRPLTARTNGQRRVGYDFTVSLNKSASILRAFAGEDDARLLDWARDDALNVMMSEVEADMQCRERRDGADHDITTGNLAFAAFHHSTARPVPGHAPDMDDHTHLLCFNASRRDDGRILAGQFGNLKRDGEYYSALFDARYAGNLQKLGFAIDRQGGKKWEVAGITQAMIDTFSKRKREIEEEARRRGINDSKAKAELGAKTRSKKQKELTPAELRIAWDAQLTDAERDALAAVYRREIEPGREITAKEAVAYAVQHCFYREAVVSERELVRVALLHGLGDVSPDRARAEMTVQGVMLAEKDGRLMATTKEAYGMERFIVNHAKAGRGGVEAVGVAAGLERGILDDEQWNAVTSLLSSCDRVQLVDSAAGVGKSTMLSVYDRGMRLAGQSVTYLATTTPAVGVLQADGFGQAESLAKFLLSEKMQDAARGGTVVVDETSMMGLRDSYRLFSVARDKDIRLIFLGDSRQHSSVTAGAFMRTLQQYGGIAPLRITEIKRQKNRHHKQAVTLLFQGKVLEAFDILDKKLGWVHEIKDADDRYRAMASAYVDALKGGLNWNEILLSSPTHSEGQRVVDAIRHMLRQQGMIGKQDHEFTRWVSADLSEAEKGDARNFRPGRVDMVQFFRRAKGHQPGSRVMVGLEGPSLIPFDQPAAFQAYRKETVHFSEGDILRFTANGMTLDGHQIRNGSAYKIAGFTAKGIRLENGWLVSKDFGHFKHGIETSHGAQSKTVKLSISGVSSQSFAAANSQQEYVDASRARIKALTFTDDKEGLRAAIQRSSLKLAAHDLVNPPAPQQPAPGWNPFQQYQQWRERRRRRQAQLARCRTDADALRRHPPTPPREPTTPTHADRVRPRPQERSSGHER
jgi:conjugative relaxase-like TrwC/TraI family protein